MIAAELINPNIPALKTTDSVEQVLEFMQEHHVSELPLVEDHQFMGLIHEADLEEMDPDVLLSAIRPPSDPVHIRSSDFFLTALKVMQQRKVSVLPVLKETTEFLGVITAAELLQAAAHYTSATEPGGVLILQMLPNNFSISEIGRIVESNDSKIIHLNTWTDEATGQLMVAIKVSKSDLQDILATLERYEYNVVHYFGENLSADELRLNFDHLMNYLNI